MIKKENVDKSPGNDHLAVCDETSLVKPDDYIVTDFFDKAYRSNSMSRILVMMMMTTVLHPSVDGFSAALTALYIPLVTNGQSVSQCHFRIRQQQKETEKTKQEKKKRKKDKERQKIKKGKIQKKKTKKTNNCDVRAVLHTCDVYDDDVDNGDDADDDGDNDNVYDDDDDNDDDADGSDVTKQTAFSNIVSWTTTLTLTGGSTFQI